MLSYKGKANKGGKVTPSPHPGHTPYKTWSYSNLRLNNSGGNAVRHHDAFIIHWHYDDILTVSETT